MAGLPAASYGSASPGALPSASALRSGPLPLLSSPGVAQDKRDRPSRPASEQLGHVAQGSVEIASKRTATTSEWHNADGSITIKQFMTPHYYQSGQSWQPIDNSLLAAPGSSSVWQSKANSWRASFGATDRSGGMEQVSYGASTVGIGPLGLSATMTPVVSGDAATYKAVWPNADLKETVTNTSVHEDLYLQNASASPSYLFGLSGATARPSASGGLDVLQSGKVVGTLPAPVVTTGTGAGRTDATKAAHASLSYANGVVTVSVSPSWLASLAPSAFPVDIDPTYQPFAFSGWTNSTNLTSYGSVSGSLAANAQFGSDANGTWDAEMQMALPAPPATQNSQPWQLTYVWAGLGCPSSCTFSNVHVGVTHTQQGSYAAVAAAAGASGPASVPNGPDTISPNGGISAFLGNSVDYAQGTYPWINVTATSSTLQTIPDGDVGFEFTYVELPPPGTVTSLSNGAVLSTVTPTLTTAVTDAQLCTVPGQNQTCDVSAFYDFAVSTAPPGQGGQIVADSGWLQGPSTTASNGTITYQTPTWTVPAGSLVDGASYYTWVASTNNEPTLYPSQAIQGHIYVTPPQGPVTQFEVKQRLDAGGSSPTDQVGSVPGQTTTPAQGSPNPGTSPASETVDMVTGNLALNVTSPSMQTLAGSAGVTFAYNSLKASALTAGATGSGSYGLTAQYYADSGSHVFPNTAPLSQRIEPSVNLTDAYQPTAALAPDSPWEARWTGQLTFLSSDVPAGTTFQIGGLTTGGMQIKVGGTTVYNDWNGTSTASGTVGFASATYTAGTSVQIEVDDWDQGTGSPTAQLWVKENLPSGSNPNTAQVVVPANWLTAQATGLPPGWSLSAAAPEWSSVSDLGSEVIAHAVTGATAVFTRTGNGTYVPPAGNDDTLTSNNGQLELSTASGYQYAFNSDGSLASITTAANDLKPAAVTYHYAQVSPGTLGSPIVLESITNPVSQQAITLTYSGEVLNGTTQTCPTLAGGASAPSGMLCQISLPDGSTANLYYNGNGQLAEVLNPGGSTTLLGYDSGNRLNDIRDALANDYIAAGQAGSNLCATGATTCPFDTQVSYDSVGRVGTISQPEPSNGAAHPSRTYTYNTTASGGTTYVSIAGFSPAGNSHIPAGYASSETFDSQSRGITQTNSAGLSGQTVWNNNDWPIIRVSTTGEQTSTVYDTSGHVTDVYGPAPTACFTAGSTNPWPTNTNYASPPAPVQGYLPVAAPTTTTGCMTAVPRVQQAYDQGITGLAEAFWPNAQSTGLPTRHGTGSGLASQTSFACAGGTGTSATALCGSWPSGSTPDGGTETGWGMRLGGTISLAAAGTYDFTGTDNQPLSLFVDGHQVGTNVTYTSTGAIGSVATSFNKTVVLTAGTHTVEVDLQGSSSTTTSYTIGDYIVGQGTQAAAAVPLSWLDPNYGLQTTSTDPDGKTTTSSYIGGGLDPSYGLRTSQTVGSGSPTPLTTNSAYETPGSGWLRKLSSTLPAGTQTTYQYYSGQQTLTAATCGVGTNVPQGGQLQSEIDPAPSTGSPGREKQFVYDALGRVAGFRIGTTSSINSVSWACTSFDARGRMLTQTWPAFGSASARTVTYTYAVNGDPRVSSVVDTNASNSSISSAVDLLGRMFAYVDSFNLLTQVFYNQAGEAIENVGPRGDVTNSYDPNTANLTTVAVGGQTLATAAYTASTGRLATVTYSNGTKATLGYDANGRKNSLVYTKLSDGSLVTGDQVTNSVAGRITSELENINGTMTNPNPAGSTATDYTYDAAGRLVSAYLPGAAASYGYGTNPTWDGCSQPNAGANTNRTQVVVTPTGGAATTTDSCYNNYDQLTATTVRSSITPVGTAQAGQNLGLLSTNTPISLTYPAGTSANDQALLAVTVASGTNVTTPTGYTQVATNTTNGLLTSNATLVVFRHTIAAGETAVSVAFSGSSARTAVLTVYRGVDTTSPIDVNSSALNNAGTTVTAPGLTTTRPADRLVVFDGQAGSSTTTWTPPSGMSTTATSQSGGAITAISADATAGNPGATAAETSTSSASGALLTTLVALAPATTSTTTSYDSHGNQTQDGNSTYTYDAADRLVSTAVGGVTTTYEYDGVGRLITRGASGHNIAYVYGGFDSAAIATRTDGGILQQLVPLPGDVTDTIQAAGAFHPVTATRVLDTRYGTGVAGGASGPITAHGTLTVQVAGVGGVPANDVTAVVINLAATTPTAPGDLQAYATGTSAPGTSNLNFATGQTIANLAIVPVGSGGSINLYNDSVGTTQVVGDIEGYYQGGTALNAGAFHPLTPTLIMDTRNGTGVTQGPVAAGGTASLQVSGVGGVPTSNVSAVVLNVTATAPTSTGSVTVYPDGTTKPNTSNLDYASGQSVANTVIVPIGSDGKVDFYNGSTGTTQMLATVEGYYLSGPSATNSGSYHPLTSTQLVNTQTGVGAPQGALVANGTLAVQVTGAGGVPASCVSAVAMTVTASSGTADGYLVAYPDGTTRPSTSNVNYTSGQTIANLVIVPVGTNGKVDITNVDSGTVQITGDISGYYECDAGAATGDLWSYPDLHGNTTVTTDNSGSRVGNILNYDPWGAPLANPVSTTNAAVTNSFTSFATAGKITDPGSGITVMGARAYNAAEGRFTSVDSLQGGCANAYVYSFGDPLTQGDLTGRASCSSVLGGFALDVGAIALGVLAIGATGGVALGFLAAGSVLATASFIVSEPGCHKDHDPAACTNMWIGYGGMASGGLSFLPEGALAALTYANLAAGGLAVKNDVSASQPSVGSCIASGLSSAVDTVEGWFS